MTNEDKQVQEKLEQLRKVMSRNEQRVRETYLEYEELLAQRQSLVSSIDALLSFRIKRLNNFFVESPEEIEMISRSNLDGEAEATKSPSH